MKLHTTPLSGLLILETVHFRDDRGGFQKLFNRDFFAENNLAVDFREFYYSVNRRGVIRGMHFQSPPHAHAKVVYVSRGRIADAVVDLRKASSTYGEHIMVELNAEDGKYLYIPEGFAHGFASLEDGTIVNYAQTTCHEPDHDAGVRYDSCGIAWPFEYPVLSARDLTFPILEKFQSPF